MRLQSRLLLYLTAFLLPALIWIASAQARGEYDARESLPQNSAPIILNVNMNDDPVLDPALATDRDSAFAIEQLFLGLVDLDDETSEVLPELATSWSVSPDGTVYTFILRDDLFWSDGNPVTAQDVRYGILRTLKPSTGANYAYVLYPILNAQDYNASAITDPNLVGVEALSSTTLRITLEEPAAQILSILSLWVARPMPQWAIDTYGSSWTEPGNIVTNGAYRLTDWTHNLLLTLDKNPTYYQTSEVQIERVQFHIADASTAWQMYLDAQLDTINVPLSADWNLLHPDELTLAPSACIYYYGFNISLAPFDNPLVRMAFAAATNRSAITSGGWSKYRSYTTTYTPRGVYGYIDGSSEGIGIEYNPTLARQWLSAAGYPNGQGLPPITISFNESAGHYQIASAVRASWESVLGATVSLQDYPWQDYLQMMNNGDLQVYRNGWCADYFDAYNFVGESLTNRSRFGGWTNPSYEILLSQISYEPDPAPRLELFRQAELTIVENDVIMIPIYHYGVSIATKSHLQRTYSASSEDIASWRITRVEQTIPTTGGALTSFDESTTIVIPPGTFTDTVIISHSPAYGDSFPMNLIPVSQLFEIEATYESSDLPAVLTSGASYSITVQYNDDDIPPAIEESIAMFYWNNNQWLQEISSSLNSISNTLTASPDHFSKWAIFGWTNTTMIPTLYRNYP